MASKQTIEVEVDNKSNFKITAIQVDEYGEGVKVKLENENEHKLVVSWGQQQYVQTLWMSPEYRRRLGLKESE